MAIIDFRCSNPHCGEPLTFDIREAGSVQHCRHCQQKLIVPDINSRPYQEPPSTHHNNLFENQPDSISRRAVRKDNAYQMRTRKRVKAGPGCLAMFATMMGIFIIAIGLIMAGHISWQSMGSITSFAGLAGIGAFAYFGYFALEEDDGSYDRRQMRDEYD